MARTLALEARGRWFKSSIPDIYKPYSSFMHQKAIFSKEESEEIARVGKIIDNQYFIAKPLNYKGIFWRIRAAWNVLKGKAFPVEWK